MSSEAAAGLNRSQGLSGGDSYDSSLQFVSVHTLYDAHGCQSPLDSEEVSPEGGDAISEVQPEVASRNSKCESASLQHHGLRFPPRTNNKLLSPPLWSVMTCISVWNKSGPWHAAISLTNI